MKVMNSWLKMTIKNTHVDVAVELLVFKAVVEAMTSYNEQNWKVLNELYRTISKKAYR